MKNNVSIVIPVYNEIGSIEKTIKDINDNMKESGLVYEIILVDDGSVDGTDRIIESMSVSNLKTITHSINRGYGAALKSGIGAAEYDSIAITDADGTYPNERIPDFVALMDQNDMVVGARVGQKVNIPTIRKPAKWAINKLADYLSQTEIPDLNSGLRVMNKKVIERFLHILPDGFSFTTTITLAMFSNGYRVTYIPIDYNKRTGKSKIRPIRDTLNFITLIARTVMYFDPLRIFVPLSLILFAASLAGIVVRIARGKGLLVVSVILFVSGIQVLTTGMIADLIDKRNKMNRGGK